MRPRELKPRDSASVDALRGCVRRPYAYAKLTDRKDTEIRNTNSVTLIGKTQKPVIALYGPVYVRNLVKLISSFCAEMEYQRKFSLN
jgi:hypothetical protein